MNTYTPIDMMHETRVLAKNDPSCQDHLPSVRKSVPTISFICRDDTTSLIMFLAGGSVSLSLTLKKTSLHSL